MFFDSGITVYLIGIVCLTALLIAIGFYLSERDETADMLEGEWEDDASIEERAKKEDFLS